MICSAKDITGNIFQNGFQKINSNYNTGRYCTVPYIKSYKNFHFIKNDMYGTGMVLIPDTVSGTVPGIA